MHERSWRTRWPGGLLALGVAVASCLLLMLFSLLGLLASGLTPFAPWDAIELPVLGRVFVIWLFMFGFVPVGAALYGWAFGLLFRRWWGFAPVAALTWLGWIVVTGGYEDEPALMTLSVVSIGFAAIVAGVTAWLAARRQSDGEGAAASAEDELATE